MRKLSILISILVIVLSCSNSYYTGNKEQDSLIKYVDNKLNSADKVYRTWHKKLYGQDSNVSYSTNRANNELLILGLAELKANKRTIYNLLNGELAKVTYYPNHRKGVSNIHFFENGKLLFERQ